MASILMRHGKYQAQVRRLDATVVSRTYTNKKDVTVWIRRI